MAVKVYRQFRDEETETEVSLDAAIEKLEPDNYFAGTVSDSIRFGDNFTLRTPSALYRFEVNN